jgi:predicted nucleic acid-binding protein
MTRLYLDASALIYLIDGPTGFREAATAALTRFGDAAWVTSYLSRLECRVKPMREKDAARLRAFDALLDPQRIELIDVGRPILDRAAEIRADHGLRTIDALHVASAIVSGCDAALTGDAAWTKVAALPIEVIRA